MKRLLICAVVLCVMLPACSQVANENINSSPTMSHQPSASTTRPSSSSITFYTQPSTAQHPGSVISTTKNKDILDITDTETYYNYLQTGRFPDGFITLAQLPEIGKITSVQTYKKEVFGFLVWAKYEYLVDRETGYDMTLAVFRNRDSYAEGKDVSGICSGYLGVIANKERYTYAQFGGFTYIYWEGILESVNWEYDGYLFHLFFDYDETGRIMPLTDETTPFIRDLLHTDTAERAMQTFKASMESVAVK